MAETTVARRRRRALRRVVAQGIEFGLELGDGLVSQHDVAGDDGLHEPALFVGEVAFRREGRKLMRVPADVEGLAGDAEVPDDIGGCVEATNDPLAVEEMHVAVAAATARHDASALKSIRTLFPQVIEFGFVKDEEDVDLGIGRPGLRSP